MEDTAIASSRWRRLALLGGALLGQVAWVIFPLLRRQGFQGVAEITLSAIAPLALCLGLARRSSGALLVGVPAGWLFVLPFAPRDQLGENEIILMAISLLAYVLCALYFLHRETVGVVTLSVDWTVDQATPEAPLGLVGVIVSAAVLLSCVVVLWLPYASNMWSAYTPGAVSRFKVGMILSVTLLGIGCLQRANRLRQHFVVRHRTGTLLGLALSMCCLVAIRRWM